MNLRSQSATVVALVVLGLSCRSKGPSPGAVGASARNGCWVGVDAASPGKRRALLIGATRSPGGPALAGASADVEAVYRLLRGETYGFSPSDICVLLDDGATVKGATDALVQLAGAKGETALVYFAGAGRQVLDRNYDEPDPWDEALALADGDLLDDTYAPLLTNIAASWSQVVLIVDASHQAAEVEVPGRTVRFAGRVGEAPAPVVAPAVITEASVAAGEPTSPGLDAPAEVQRDGAWPADLGMGDGGHTWHVSGLDNLITLSASRLGAAVELDGHGVFTAALLGALGTPGQTFDTVALQTRPLVAARSDQIPGFEGETGAVALSAAPADKPLSWRITGYDKKTGQVALEGIQLPGWSPGALLRVFPATATRATAADPANAVAVVKIEALRGFTATASLVLEPGQDAPKLSGGELAVLARPGADVARIQVRLRTGTQPTDLTDEQVSALRAAIAADPTLAATLELVETGGFAVGRDPARPGALQVIGPEGSIRNTMVPPEKEGDPSVVDKVLHNLSLHARQKALFHLQGEPGAALVNDRTLAVRLVPAEAQDECATGVWIQAQPNTEQIVPVCHRWQVEVTLAADAPYPLEVGGVILANDGNILGFPTDGQVVALSPGETHLFALRLGKGKPGVKSVPPLGITEHVLVYGTQVGNAVKYNELTATATRGTTTGVGGAIQQTLSPDGGSVSASALDVGAWTRTAVPYRVEANTAMRPEAAAAADAAEKRELTLNHFDVTPYLPADTNSYLYKFLQNAKYLADFEPSPGKDIAYAQCWPVGSPAINNTSRYSTADWPRDACWSKAWEFSYDQEELRDSPGIDCSTTAWWTYTRTCKGDTSLPMPARAKKESSAAYTARVLKWHADADQRGCLLMNYGLYRAGYATTSQLVDPKLMGDEWDSCLGVAYRPGDMLVTRNASNSSGHVYMVIDPENYVVFGSHGGDSAWAGSMKGLTDEEKAFLAKYEEIDKASLDDGVEFQYLTWGNKSDLDDRWKGFSSERVKACWRNKRMAQEWESNPASRPGSADLSAACKPDACNK